MEIVIVDAYYPLNLIKVKILRKASNRQECYKLVKKFANLLKIFIIENTSEGFFQCTTSQTFTYSLFLS